METCLDRNKPTPGLYFLGILFPWTAVCALIITQILIDPATACSPPEAMCCYICAVFAWLTYMPVVGYIFAIFIFAPGFLIVAFIERSIRRWRPFYWIFGWMLAGTLPAIMRSAIIDRHREILVLMFGVFGLLCGFC